jgi:hypothetical protein
VVVRIRDRQGNLKIPDRDIVVRLITELGEKEGYGAEANEVGMR